MKRTLTALLLGLCLCLSLAIPAAAAPRTVPVTVDDALLPGQSYLSGGVTSVPLRNLLDALGGWQLSWNRETRQAEAVSGGRSIQAKPGAQEFRVNGVRYPGTVYLRDGRTYVPLRALCEALGLSVRWDGTLGGAAVSSGRARSYDAEALYWLSRIISAESRGESLEGQIAVGNVVLNRVRSGEFPDSVRGVVFDRKDGVQFEPVSNGSVYDEPTARSVLAAKAALAGTDIVGRCLYFYAPALSQGTWIRANRTYYTTIGCHRFYL